MARLLPRLRALPQERGSALIEILVTVLLLAIVSAGIFASLDRATATSGEDKARGSAALVAEQDQERLRAMESTQLSNRRETRTVTVRGVPYTVTSRSQWVSDQSGTLSCTNPTAGADYMKITSTVTWGSMGSAKPVKSESIVAPRALTGRGNLSVQVLNRVGDPTPGIPVRVTGGSLTADDTTDSLGCIYLGQIPPGSYNVQFASAGYVTPDGATAVNDPATVSSGNTTTKLYEFDRAGSVTVTFDTRVNGGAPFAQTGEYVSLGHGRLSAPRAFGNGSSQSSITAGGLFPFTSPYGVYSGNCAGADPTNYGQVAGSALVTPGGALSVTVREPALNVRTMRSGSVVSGAHVEATMDSTGCNGTLDMGLTNSNGALDNPGVPYGDDYDLCAEAFVSGRWREGSVNNVRVTDPVNGSALTTINLSSNGTC